MHNLWKWFIPHSLFTFLKHTIIKCLCFTEREYAAKGVEVSQRGMASELPKSFISLLVTVQTCLPIQWAARLSYCLPHTPVVQTTLGRVCFVADTSKKTDCLVVTGGDCGKARQLNVTGIVLALCWQKMPQSQAKVLSVSHCGNHKHGLLGQPSYSPCDVVLAWQSALTM